MASSSRPRPRPAAATPPGAARAKLQGSIFAPHSDHPFTYYLRQPRLVIGRSDTARFPHDPLSPTSRDVDIGVGVTNKLSRIHAVIEWCEEQDAFLLKCVGKNGVIVVLPPHNEAMCLDPDSKSLPLTNRSMIQMGECIFFFMLPCEVPTIVVRSRKWLKSEQQMLRAYITRFGFGRWDLMLRLSNGRVSERTPDEIEAIARRFIAIVYVHSEAAEKKSMFEILRESSPADSEDDVEYEVKEFIDNIATEISSDDKSKFLRWGRKLRLLKRIRDLLPHWSLQKLKAGGINILTPKPIPGWTHQDDYDLVVGTHKHGLGHFEPIHDDPDLGFANRYFPAPAARRGKVAAGLSISNGQGYNDDDDDHDDDVGADDDDDPGSSGDGAVKDDKKSDVEMSDVRGSPPLSYRGNKEEAPKEKVEEKMVVKKEDRREDLKKFGGSTSPSPSSVKPSDVIKTENADVHVNSIADEMSGMQVESDTGNCTKTNEEKVSFPPSEALMKRLKSVVCACSKEYEREKRESRKIVLAQTRASQRRHDSEQRRRDKEAEKLKMKEKRKMERSQPFSRKEATDFEKALMTFGIEYDDDDRINWTAFVRKVPQFQYKYEDTLDETFHELNREAGRLVEMSYAREAGDTARLNEINHRPQSVLFKSLTPDRAAKFHERNDLFRILRSQMLKNPAAGSVLKGVKRTKDLPFWWKNFHDCGLLLGVHRFGFGAWEIISTDTSLPFDKSINDYAGKLNDDDPKNARKYLFPKQAIAIKRVMALVNYFRNYSFESNPIAEPFSLVEGAVLLEPKVKKTEAQGSAAKKASTVKPSTAKASAPKETRDRPGLSTSAKERAVPLNLVDANGYLVLPAQVTDGLYILELGVIVPRTPFYSVDLLLPVGYRAVRQMPNSAYLMEIPQITSETGAATRYSADYPIFRISRLIGFQTHDDTKPMWHTSEPLSEDPDIQRAWMKAMNDQEDRIRVANGAEMFGLYEPTILHYLQQLENADRCNGYKMRNFSRPVPEPRNQVTNSPGILAAMTNALNSNHVKRPAAELHQEMDIPPDWTEQLGGGAAKRLKSGTT